MKWTKLAQNMSPNRKDFNIQNTNVTRRTYHKLYSDKSDYMFLGQKLPKNTKKRQSLEGVRVDSNAKGLENTGRLLVQIEGLKLVIHNVISRQFIYP